MMTKSYDKGNTNAMYRKKGKHFNRKINTGNVTALMKYYKKGKLNAFLLYFVKIFIFTLLIWIYQCDNSKGIIQQCCAKFDKVNMVYIRPNRFLGEILKYEEQGKEKAQQELFSKKDKTDQDSKFKVDTRAHTDKMDSTNESKSRDKSQGILALENKNASPRKSRLFKICKETFLLRRFGDFVALVSLSFFVAFVSLASLGHGLAAFPFLMGSIFCFPLMDTLNKIVSNKDLQ